MAVRRLASATPMNPVMAVKSAFEPRCSNPFSGLTCRFGELIVHIDTLQYVLKLLNFWQSVVCHNHGLVGSTLFAVVPW